MLTLMPGVLFRGTRKTDRHQQAGQPELRARLEKSGARQLWGRGIARGRGFVRPAVTQSKKFSSIRPVTMQATRRPAGGDVFEKKPCNPVRAPSRLVIADSAEQAVGTGAAPPATATVAKVESMPRIWWATSRGNCQ